MRKPFVETREFTEWAREYLTDDGLSGLQRVLLNDPDTGAVIPGCGGLRKIRVADPRRGKGKRGGVRVIYLHVPEADVILLMDAFGKGEQEDLTSGQRKVLKGLADAYKRATVRAAGTSGRGGS
jgi:hypothetical protein